MTIQPEHVPVIRGHLKQIEGLVQQVSALLAPPPDPKRHPEAQGEYGLPLGTQDACQWAPGRPHPTSGELVPLPDSSREFLRGMARARGTRGLVWVKAIEAAQTMTDGKDLSERLKQIDPGTPEGGGPPAPGQPK